MGLESLLLVILCVILPFTMKGESIETRTLLGRLMLVERDFIPGQETSRGSNSDSWGNTHYILVGPMDSVWGLSFQPGREPPSYPGLTLEVEVLAAELEAEAAGPLGAGGNRRRSLIESGVGANGSAANIGQAASGAASEQQPHLRNSSTCHRQLNQSEGKPCNIGRVEGTHSGSDTKLTMTHGGGRLLSEDVDAAVAQGSGQLTVVNWRQVRLNQFSTSAAAVVETRAAFMDPYNEYDDNNRITMDDVSTVVYILDMCGHGPAARPEDLEAALFGRDRVTLESYLSYCSAGVANFGRDNVLILGPVEVPCSGTSPYYFSGDPEGVGAPWYTSSCRPRDYVGWLKYAQNWGRERGYDVDAYRHHVALGSPNQEYWMVWGDGSGRACDWSGLAFIGPIDEGSGGDLSRQNGLLNFNPGVFGYAWINGDFWYSMAGWAHELAHNYYLKHATEMGCEYCDATCAMGFCCEMRCFNAPHAWQLGWAEPIGNYNWGTLPVGRMMQRSLVAAPGSTPLGAALRIEANGLPDDNAKKTLGLTDNSSGYKPYVWVAYRKAAPPFDNLPVDQLNHVSIYLIFENRDEDATSGTIKLGTMGPGQVWRHPGYGLHVHVVKISNNRGLDVATVKFCRMEREAENEWRYCIDGLDNDCDGLTDEDDPDCSVYTRGQPDGAKIDIETAPDSLPNADEAPDIPPPTSTPFTPDLTSVPMPGVYAPLFPPMAPVYPSNSPSGSLATLSSNDLPLEEPAAPDFLSPLLPSPYTPDPFPPVPLPPSLLHPAEPIATSHAGMPDTTLRPSFPSSPSSSPSPRRWSVDPKEAMISVVPGLYGYGRYYEGLGAPISMPPPANPEALSRQDWSLAASGGLDPVRSGAATPDSRQSPEGKLGNKYGPGVQRVPSAQHPRPPSSQRPSPDNVVRKTAVPEAASARLSCAGHRGRCKSNETRIATKAHTPLFRGGASIPGPTGSQNSRSGHLA